MTRTDHASQVVNAEPEDVFAALVNPTSLVQWLPPSGMSGRFERFDARPGGSYRLALEYDEDMTGEGKTSQDADVVEVRFLEVVPSSRIVQAVDFVSDDPAFAGTMTMTWELSKETGGTRVDIRAENVPSGIRSEDHSAGMQSSLANLATFVENIP